MDFSARNSQSSSAASRPSESFAPSAPVSKSSRHDKDNDPKWFKRGYGVLLVVVALLLAALVGYMLTVNNSKEGDLVDSSKLQAVFLQNDQVYFGHITTLNSRYLVLHDIYYLQTSNSSNNSSTNASNVSLVKLGCELHRPYDQMVVNRAEVEFWENLQDGGQVANAVAKFKQQNPNGQKCSNTTTNNQNVQGSNGSTNTNANANSNTNANTNTNANNSNNNTTTP
jgi:hypothetical protein